MPSLREYLKRRRGEIHAESEQLTRQCDKLQRQLHAVLVRLDELGRESADLDQAMKAVGLEPDAQAALAPEPAVESSRTSTIKDAVLHVLAEAPGGMTSQAILDQINTRFFSGRIERTSFSPQLSRLRGELKVVRRGELWELTAKGSLAPGFEHGDEVPRVGRRRTTPGRRFARRPRRRQSDRRQPSAAPAIGPPRAEPEPNGGSPSTAVETLDPNQHPGNSRE
jgi:hypothetical protein